MAETATATPAKTTTPRRPRSAGTAAKAPAKAAAAPAAPKAAATKPAAKPATKAAAPLEPPAPVVEEAPADDRMAIVFAPAPKGATRRYTTFDLSMDIDGNATGCVGTVYAPPGTEEVKVQLIGPAGVFED